MKSFSLLKVHLIRFFQRYKTLGLMTICLRQSVVKFTHVEKMHFVNASLSLCSMNFTNTVFMFPYLYPIYLSIPPSQQRQKCATASPHYLSISWKDVAELRYNSINRESVKTNFSAEEQKQNRNLLNMKCPNFSPMFPIVIFDQS